MAKGNGRNKIKIQGLFLRGSIWYYRYQEDGKRKTICLETRDQDEAMRKIAETRARPDLVDMGKWAELVNLYITTEVRKQVLSSHYARSRRTSLLKVGLDLKVEHPREISLSMLQRWFYELLEKVKPGTAVHYLQHVRVFLAWLVNKQVIRENVALEIDDDGADSEEREVVVSSHILAKLIKAAQEEDPIMEAILLLASEAGMRKGEIVQCRWEWFAQPGYVRVPKKQETDVGGPQWRRKNRNKVAHVPLSRPLQEWLERNNGLDKMGYVLQVKAKVESQGKWVYRYDPKKRFNDFMTRHGCEEVTLHDLRRSFGSNRLSAGCTIEQVAMWMGISPATAWKHYARWLPPSADINKGAAW